MPFLCFLFSIIKLFSLNKTDIIENEKIDDKFCFREI